MLEMGAFISLKGKEWHCMVFSVEMYSPASSIGGIGASGAKDNYGAEDSRFNSWLARCDL